MMTNEEIQERHDRLQAISALPNCAIVRATPIPGKRVEYKGCTYEFPRKFTVTMGEVRASPVGLEVMQIVDANPTPPDAPTLAQRVTRGRGLNRMLDDSAGLDRS